MTCYFSLVLTVTMILNSDPSDVLARHDLSLCYRSLGWKREAIEEMRTAKECADNFGNPDEKKVVETSLRNLEGEMDRGKDEEPSVLLRKLVLAVILGRKRKVGWRRA